MRSPSPFAWLVRKAWGELLASRAWWVLMIAIGPLVGVAFISAVRTYADLSGLNGTAAGVGEAFSPLVGIWAPTFSACELAAVFLLPFVAIRVFAEDRVSGALKMELQRPLHPAFRVGSKALVLLAGWAIATLAPFIAVLLWRAYGGHVFVPEILSVTAGHLLNAGLTIALAAAASTMTDHPSTAAIVTLAVTVGTWILNFTAAVHGGVWQRAAEFTPTAMVSEFQHGLIRLDTVLATSALVIAGLGLAAIWTQIGTAVRRRVAQSVILSVVAIGALTLSSSVARAAWDTSENRMNSFTRADERVLRALDEPLRITAYLAPEDPRRSDLERRAVSKLRRVVRDFDIRYLSATSTGLFEQSSERYGEIHYRLGPRETVSRAVTVEGVLDAIYSLAGRAPSADLQEEDDSVFRGHPLPARPVGAAFVFYGAWPSVTLLAALRSRRRGS